MATEHDDDVHAINQIISRQFASLSWAPGTSGDWQAFAADFVPDASLYPAARPAKRQNVWGFIERMKSVQESKLRSFHEAVLGTEVRVFGNIAVAIAGCEITENGTDVNRGVEMLLLIKNEGEWRIVSQAWDTETSSKQIPERLVSGELADRN
jgi:ketosteroid isomerase-like protein